MTEQKTPAQIVAETQRRLLAKEEVTDEELLEGIRALRADREAKVASSAKKATEKKAEAQRGEDLLDNL